MSVLLISGIYYVHCNISRNFTDRPVMNGRFAMRMCFQWFPHLLFFSPFLVDIVRSMEIE